MKLINENKGVISIFVVLGIGLFALGSTFILAKGVLQQMTTNRNIRSTYQAFYTAESGASEGAYQFLHLASYAGGTLAVLNSTSGDISVTPPSFGVAEIRGKSEKSGSHREVFYKVAKYPDGPAFSYGIYTPYKIELSGRVTVNDGKVFAGEQVCCGGFKADGSCDKPYPENNCSNVTTGDIVKGEDASPPTIESQPYIDAAQANTPTSSYFPTSSDIPNKYFKNLKTGVIFVDSNLTISESSAKINGALWVHGDLNLSGGTFTATDNYFAVIVEGNLKINGNTTINGIVYVKGGVEIGSGNVTINGSLICMGDTSLINAGGNLTVNYQDLSNTWDNLAGLQLNCNGLCPGKIDNWGER